jgi:hypothetical protein
MDYRKRRTERGSKSFTKGEAKMETTLIIPTPDCMGKGLAGEVID